VADTRTTTEATSVRPFQVNVPDGAIEDLRRRIAATRWRSQELVADRSQGVQLTTTQELARYWATEYDWRKCEARLNALPPFTTEIDGVEIHFINVRSRHENAMPLIMTHGWPGSVIELLDTIGPLTDPTASRRSPTRSGLPSGAGSMRSTPASPTSTRSARAATSPPGKSLVHLLGRTAAAWLSTSATDTRFAPRRWRAGRRPPEK